MHIVISNVTQNKHYSKGIVMYTVHNGYQLEVIFCVHHYYLFVAPFAERNNGFGGSHLMHEVLFANFTFIIDDKVPFGSRHDLVGVLFCLIRLKTLSSPALLCRIIRTNLATFAKFPYFSDPSTHLTSDK